VIAAVLVALGANVSTLLACTGVALAGVAIVVAVAAWRLFPKQLLLRTRRRVAGEIHRIEDHANGD